MDRQTVICGENDDSHAAEELDAMRERAETAEAERSQARRDNETSRNLLSLANGLLDDANAENESMRKRIAEINAVCEQAMAALESDNARLREALESAVETLHRRFVSGCNLDARGEEDRKIHKLLKTALEGKP